MMAARKVTASGSSIEIRVPSAAGVMQAITMRPRLSFSSLNCLTAHCRQAPTEPSAGCQQKYGRLKPAERQPWSRFCSGFISYGLPSTKILAIPSPGAALLPNVPLEVVAEIFESALQGLGRAGRQGAEGIAPEPGLKLHLLQIAGLALAVFHGPENALDPSQAAPARRAPSAGFLSEEFLKVPDHADRAGLIVQHDHRSGSQAAAGFGHFGKVHGRIEVLLGQKIGGGSSGQ